MLKFIKILIVCLFITILLIRKALLLVTVKNLSMFPALIDGDVLLVLRYWPYKRLQRGQLVIFTQPSNRENVKKTKSQNFIIKRIKGLPGDIVAENSYNLSRVSANTRKDELQTWYIPPGYFFALGDNLLISVDSRVWGPVPLRNLVGIVLVKLSTSKF